MSTKMVKEIHKALSLICGDCTGYANDAITPNGTLETCSLCNKGERPPTAKTCKRFVPKVTGSRAKAPDLADMVKGSTPEEVRELAIMMMSASITKQHGYDFMQEVYVRYRGRSNSNYVSNFMRAHVLYADESIMKVGAADGTCVMTYKASAFPTLLTPQEWEPLLRNMLDNNKLVDPDTRSFIQSRYRAIELYELNMVDLSFQEERDENGEITPVDIKQVFKGNSLNTSIPSYFNDIEDVASQTDEHDLNAIADTDVDDGFDEDNYTSTGTLVFGG